MINSNEVNSFETCGYSDLHRKHAYKIIVEFIYKNWTVSPSESFVKK